MPVLTVGNQVFQYPDPGTEAGWGEDATGWASAVTASLAALRSPGDILPTTLTLQNNISTPTDVLGLFFNSNSVQAAQISYSIYRVSTSTNPGIAESGIILLDFNATATVGNKWNLTQLRNGDAHVAFSVTDGGQVQYISNDIGLTGYTGVMSFLAKVSIQA
jgi:hypothetical protein